MIVGPAACFDVTPMLTPVRTAADEAVRWSWVSVDIDATVREARELVRDSGQSVLIVLSHGDPVGIVTKAELWGLEGVGPRGDLPIGQVVRWELVEIPPDTDVTHTLRLHRAAAWASLFRRHPARPTKGATCRS